MNRIVNDKVNTALPSVFDTAARKAVKPIDKRSGLRFEGGAVPTGPNVDAVFRSLKKQSNLLRGMDNLAPKAAAEANNVLMRAVRNLQGVVQFRGFFNQVGAAALGIGGLGASAALAPYFTVPLAAGMVTYAGGRAAISPITKRMLASLLKHMDKVISNKSGSNSLIHQLRVDRAALKEILETAVVAAEESKGDLLKTYLQGLSSP